MKNWYDLAVCTRSLEGQPYPGLQEKKCSQQVKGGDSAPLLRTHETPPGVLRPALEASAQERHGPVGAVTKQVWSMALLDLSMICSDSGTKSTYQDARSIGVSNRRVPLVMT